MGLLKSLINEGTQFVQYQSQHSRNPAQPSSSSRGSSGFGTPNSYTPPPTAPSYPAAQYYTGGPQQQYGYSSQDGKRNQGYPDDRETIGYPDDRKTRQAYPSNGPSAFDPPPSYDQAESYSNVSRAMNARDNAPQEWELRQYPSTGANQEYYQASEYPSQSTCRSLAPSNGGLAVPIIIPPQRPGNIGRGFRAAYAPDLQYSGIDKTYFLQFLHDLNDGFTDSKALMPVQVACFGAGFAPSMIAMGVTMAVSMAATAANKQFVRHKVNIVLDQYNQHFFAPRGLYVLIMKYDPMMGMDTQGSSRGGELIQLAGTVGKMAMSGGGRGGSWAKDYTAGTSGSVDLPTEAARLVFLDDDPEWLAMKPSMKSSKSERDGAASGAVTPEKKNKAASKFSHFMNNVDGYLDQRARNNYLAENGQSVLTEGSSSTVLTQVFGMNKSILGRDSSRGKDGRSSGYSRREEDDRKREYDRYNQERQRVLNDRQSASETDRELRKVHEEFNSRMRELNGRKGSGSGSEDSTPKKKITKDVVYLMIVNKPSQSQMEMAAANAGNIPVAMIQA